MVSESYARDFICGVGSAISTTVITYPINKLIYRQILEGAKAPNAMLKIKLEGPLYLYRGVLPPMVQKAVSLSTMFGMYNTVTLPLKKYELNQYVEKLCASYVSGSLEAVFMPFERIQVLLVHSEYHQRFYNTFHAFLEIKKNYGVKEYYRGFIVVWFRNTLSNSCFFTLKAELQKISKVDESVYRENLKNFCFGGVLGAFMSTLFYPLKVMKIIVHKDIGGPFEPIYRTALKVYRKDSRGMRNFYQGVIVNAFRSLFSWGVTNMVFEFMKTIVA